MGRRATVFWHAALSVAAGVLYFFFVLPRWPELMGETSHGLGTAARIVCGIFVGLAALPVVLSLVQLRKPEFGTPALALNLRTGSVVAQVAAGVLIVAAAISEIWLSPDTVGRWLFGVYGAAAAIALLGIAGFYLSFVAEQPPAPPKPLKPKKSKKQRRLRAATDEAPDEAVGPEDSEDDDEDSAEEIAEPADEEADAADEAPASEAPASEDTPDVEKTAAQTAPTMDEASSAEEATETAEAEPGRLRNRRPSGKGTHRRRTRRGVAIDE